MRDISDRRPVASKNEADDFWWFRGLFFVAAVLATFAHFGMQRSYALERAAVGDREEVQQITEADRQELAEIILGNK